MPEAIHPEKFAAVLPAVQIIGYEPAGESIIADASAPSPEVAAKMKAALQTL